MQRGYFMYLKYCLLCLHYNPVCNINYPANTVAMTLLKAIKARISISDLHPTLPICSWTSDKVLVPSVRDRGGMGTDHLQGFPSPLHSTRKVQIWTFGSCV